MDRKKAIGATLALALIITSMGMIVAAQDAQSDGAAEADAVELTDGEQANGTAELRVLITEEQRAQIRDAVELMRAENATHEDIMAAMDEMEDGFVAQNLESYGLDEVQATEILDAMDAIDSLEQELRDTMEEYHEMGVGPLVVRNETREMFEELRTLRENLRGLLEQYEILPPLPPRMEPGGRHMGREGIGPGPENGCMEQGAGMPPEMGGQFGPGGHGFEP